MCGKAGAQQECATAAQQVHGRCAGFVRFFMNLLRPITNMFEGPRAADVALKYNVFHWNLKIFQDSVHHKSIETSHPRKHA